MSVRPLLLPYPQSPEALLPSRCSGTAFHEIGGTPYSLGIKYGGGSDRAAGSFRPLRATRHTRLPFTVNSRRQVLHIQELKTLDI